MKRTLLALSLLGLAGCYGGPDPATDSVPAPVSAPAEPRPKAHACAAPWCVDTVLEGTHDLQNVWALTPTDAWAADLFGHLYHWNGSAWVDTQGAPHTYGASGVWGTTSNDVWAVGDDGIQHWDGASWSVSSRAGSLPLQGVWGTGPNDVWALGGGFTLEHWDGTKWSVTREAEQCCDFTRAWGSTPDDVWALSDSGFSHWDGTSWTWPDQKLSQIGEGIWGFSADDVWVVGQFGLIGHFDGARWTQVRAARDGQADLTSVWGSRPDDVWAVGDRGTILHFDGTTWSSSPSGVTQLLEGVWGTSAGDVWAVGSDVILHHG